jgi:hypothetical protein
MQSRRLHVKAEPPFGLRADLGRITFNLIQIEGNPRPAQAGRIAVALHRVNPMERNTL